MMYSKMSESEKRGLSEEKAIALMLAHLSMIKRPVLDIDGEIVVGFKPEIYQDALASARGRSR